MARINYIDAETVRIERKPGSIHLRAQLADRCVPNARFKSVFPLSVPNSFVSISDAASEEVAIIKNPDALDAESRAHLEEEFDRRYFTPRLNRLKRVKMEAGMWHFVADSQRGEVDFFVRNWRDSAQEIAPGRWHINSVDGARYEITNLEGLDDASRKLMDQLL